MKKNRILSTLLAAALTLSCIPAAVGTSVAATQGIELENIIEKGTFSANCDYKVMNDVREANGNKFLRVTDRSDMNAGIIWRTDFSELEEGEVAFVSFDMRIPCASDTNYIMRAYQCAADGSEKVYWRGVIGGDNSNNTTGINEQTFTSEWKTVELVLINPTTYEDGAYLKLRGKNGSNLHPYDIDNIKVFTRKDNHHKGEIMKTVAEFDFEGTVSYGENPGDLDYLGNPSLDIVEGRKNPVTRLAGSASASEITYTFDNVTLNAGTYKFTADIRCADYTGSGNTLLDEAEFSVTAVIDGKNVDLASDTFTNAWMTAESEDIALEDGAVITELKISTDCVNAAFDISGAKLEFTPTSTTTLETNVEDNLLDGVPMTVVDGFKIDCPATGHLRVGERVIDDSMRFFYTTLPVELFKDTKYFVSFDIYTENGEIQEIRPYFPGLVSKERIDQGLEYSFLMPGSSNGVANTIGNNRVIYSVGTNGGGTPEHFEGYFTLESGSVFQLKFNRGTVDAHRHPLIIDNLKVWHIGAGGKTVTDFETDFSTAPETLPSYTDERGRVRYEIGADNAVYSATAEIDVINPEAAHYAVAAEDGKCVAVSFDTSAINTKSGVYTFSTKIASDEISDGTAKIVFNLSNGAVFESDIVNVPVTNVKYAEMSASVSLKEEVSIVSVDIVTDIAGVVKFVEPVLAYSAPEDDGGMPSIGIVMVMLLKKQTAISPDGAGSAEPEAPKEEPKNLIENGDFDAAPTISAVFDRAVPGFVENDGTDAEHDPKTGAAIEGTSMFYDHTMTYEDGAVTVRGRQYNLRPFYFHTGVVIEPGNYKLTVKVKTANKNEFSSLRFAVNDAARLNADYFYSPTSFGISNKYVEHTETFTATQTTTVVLRFRGGPGTENIHDITIDSIELIKVD